jgi:DNA-binding CsgD family transcriptional regulator
MMNDVTSVNAIRVVDDEPPVTSMMRRIYGMFDRHLQGKVAVGCSAGRASPSLARRRLVRAKLARAEYPRLRELRKQGLSQFQMAAELMVSPDGIREAIERMDGPPRGFFERPEVRECIRLYRAGVPQCEIARELGFVDSWVSRTLSRWRRNGKEVA